jgi:hypothetical protein
MRGANRVERHCAGPPQIWEAFLHTFAYCARCHVARCDDGCRVACRLRRCRAEDIRPIFITKIYQPKKGARTNALPLRVEALMCGTATDTNTIATRALRLSAGNAGGQLLRSRNWHTHGKCARAHAHVPRLVVSFSYDSTKGNEIIAEFKKEGNSVGARASACVRVSLRVCLRVLVFAFAHVCLCVRARVRARMFTHAGTIRIGGCTTQRHACAHTRIRTHTHARARTHKQVDTLEARQILRPVAVWRDSRSVASLTDWACMYRKGLNR